MRRISIAISLALTLVCVAPLPSSGCAGALPLIHSIATVVADVTGALDVVEDVVHSRPDADPALVKRVDDAIAKARALVEVVRAAAQAGQSASTRDYAAAVNALLDAYDAVTDAAKAFGVLQAPAITRGRLGATAPGVVTVPTTEELRAGLLRESGS